MVSTFYPMISQSEWDDVKKILPKILDLMNELENQFHNVASIVTHNYHNIFGEDLQGVFQSIRQLKKLYDYGITFYKEKNNNKKKWRGLRQKFWREIGMIRGGAEILLNSLQEFSPELIKNIRLLIMIVEGFPPLISRLNPHYHNKLEDIFNSKIYPSCFVSHLNEQSTILIIDPDDEKRIFFTRRLRLSHYKILEARDEMEAIKIFADQSIDLILLDSNIVEESNYRILHRFKYSDFSLNIPIIILLSDVEMEIISQCIHAGANDYVHIIMDTTLFFTRITTWINIKKLTSILNSRQE